MSKFIKFTAGAMLGGVIGAVVAMMLAPESGAELRGRVVETAQGIIADIHQAANERRASLEKELAQLRSPRQ